VRRLILTALTFLALAAPARAANFTVTGFADPVGVTCAGATCPSLRAALTAANGNGNPTETDSIALPAGPYQVTQGELPITEPVVITGEGPRTTSITRTGATNFRLFNIAATAGDVLIDFVTLSNGRSTAAGGNVINFARLSLAYVRVSGGVASTGGGGVATFGPGTLTVISSLFDGNSAGTLGGAIFLTANSGNAIDAGTVTVGNATITGNSSVESGAAGIAASGNAGNTVDVIQSTVARNGGVGLFAAGSGTFEVGGSIVASNGVANCNVVPSDLGGNLEDLDSCAFRGTGSLHGVDPKLAGGTSPQGGFTDVLPILDGSPAIDIVRPCLIPLDQRDVLRYTNGGDPCDAGAFELTPSSGTAAQPSPQPQTPTPTPTPSPTPTPVPQEEATGTSTGTVLIKLPGGKFVAFDPTKPIPDGTEIDTTKGRITLTAILKPGAKPQTATFYDGIFKLKLGKTTTDLTLSQPLAKCSTKAGAAAKKPKTRKLWGNGSGSFRTRGQYSAATVRGTQWLVQDSCAGTLTRVVKGVVAVRDNVKRKTILVKAGKKYLAKPRR
jgi:predicted outer membrane repeat protein